MPMNSSKIKVFAAAGVLAAFSALILFFPLNQDQSSRFQHAAAAMQHRAIRLRDRIDRFFKPLPVNERLRQFVDPQ